jgi:hypothetical protein
VSDLMAKNPDFDRAANDALRRHLSGDWGDLPEGDRDLNNAALVNGDRLFSVYPAPGTEGRVVIVTEGDRRMSLMMFPAEY